MTPAEYLKEVSDAMDHEPSVYAVGRGGRGNLVTREKKHLAENSNARSSSEKKSDSVRPVWSLRSNKSVDSEGGLWNKLKSTISH